MNQHSHNHNHGHHPHGHKPKSGLHKDWRLWLVVGLMLAAMAMYVYTNDEADPPGSTAPQPPVDAAP